MPAMRAKADAGEDGTGRGTPLISETAKAVNISDGVAKPAPVLGTLQSRQTSGGTGSGCQINLALIPVVGADVYNGTITGDVAAMVSTKTGSAGGSGPFALYTTEGRFDNQTPEGIAPPLKAPPNVQAVAFAQNTRDEVRIMDVPGALAAQPGMKQTSYVAIAFTERTRAEGRTLEMQQDLAYALTIGGGIHSRELMDVAMRVRRLTPTECLRLMGFPDDWFDGLGFSDSTKYRMCGNAVVVNVAQWTWIRSPFCGLDN